MNRPRFSWLSPRLESRRRDDGGWIVYKGPARLEHEDPARWRHVQVEIVIPAEDERELALRVASLDSFPRFNPPQPSPIVEVGPADPGLRPDGERVDRSIPFLIPSATAPRLAGEWSVVLPRSATPGAVVRLRTSLLSARHLLAVPYGPLEWEAILEVDEWMETPHVQASPGGEDSQQAGQ
ncbi:hypothetical protein ABT352_32915 [Streptosporangium sp. NPDC000563]|uniref:hypothetical protein n=1 Tax=Streptosporangium sp. NPDC000563 TaxID=3154366 RepID=UPI0033173E08